MPTDQRGLWLVSNYHNYHLGVGLYDQNKTMKPIDSVIPSGVVRVPENIAKVDPENNLLTTF